MSTSTWIGTRENKGAWNEIHYVKRLDTDGKLTCLPEKRDVVEHSPTGLNWGYYGSGPCQLALAIVSDFFGGDEAADKLSVILYQGFKNAVIGELPDNWTLSRSEVGEVIANLLCATEAA